MSNWTRFRRFVLPSLTLAIFLVSLIHSFLKTETVEEGLGSQVTRSIWLASKIEIDYLRLLANLERYGLDEAGIRHEDVTAGFVRLRGRLVALLEGEDAGLLRRSFEDEIDATVRPLLAAVEACGRSSKASIEPIQLRSAKSGPPCCPLAPPCMNWSKPRAG